MLQVTFEELCCAYEVSPVPHKRRQHFKMFYQPYPISVDSKMCYHDHVVGLPVPTFKDYLVSFAANTNDCSSMRSLCDFEEFMNLFWMNKGFFSETGCVIAQNIVNETELEGCDGPKDKAFWSIARLLYGESVKPPDPHVLFDWYHPCWKRPETNYELVRTLAIDFMETALDHKPGRIVNRLDHFQKTWDSIKNSLR